jgi:hypothetical protein
MSSGVALSKTEKARRAGDMSSDAWLFWTADRKDIGLVCPNLGPRRWQRGWMRERRRTIGEHIHKVQEEGSMAKVEQEAQKHSRYMCRF